MGRSRSLQYWGAGNAEPTYAERPTVGIASEELRQGLSADARGRWASPAGWQMRQQLRELGRLGAQVSRAYAPAARQMSAAAQGFRAEYSRIVRAAWGGFYPPS